MNMCKLRIELCLISDFYTYETISPTSMDFVQYGDISHCWTHRNEYLLPVRSS